MFKLFHARSLRAGLSHQTVNSSYNFFGLPLRKGGLKGILKTMAADKEADYKKLNITNEVTITRSDLPLHCPTNVSALWCAHPKVYLPIEDSKTGSARCPYCGTLYHLKD